MTNLQATQVADTLCEVVDAASKRLVLLDEAQVCVKPSPHKWSAKETLGHLVDSAVNNHHRFVRAQDAIMLVFPKYEQDAWVNAQHYNTASWSDLVVLWHSYNHHLAHVVRHIPTEKLAVECRIGPYEPVTLGFLVEDYLVHLKHHLGQILESV